MNRPALIISILLTTLVLTIVGGVVYSVHNIQVAQAAQAAQAAQVAQPNQPAGTDAQANSAAGATLDPQTQQALLDREAAYQKMIADANARLAQDQQNMQALQAQVTALQSSAQGSAQGQAVSASSAAASGVSPQTAASIASQYLGDTKVYSVETAAYNGANVFKITFSSGSIVYVSFDGQVLAVQPAPRQRSGGQVASNTGGEHEGGGDD